jgi:hypothetical protein
VRAAYDVERDGQVVRNKISRVSVVGVDAADQSGGEKDCIRARALEPGFRGLLIGQVERAPIRRQDFTVFLRQTADNGRSRQAAVTGNKNALAAEIKEELGGHRVKARLSITICQFRRDGKIIQ